MPHESCFLALCPNLPLALCPLQTSSLSHGWEIVEARHRAVCQQSSHDSCDMSGLYIDDSRAQAGGSPAMAHAGGWLCACRGAKGAHAGASKGDTGQVPDEGLVNAHGRTTAAVADQHMWCFRQVVRRLPSLPTSSDRGLSWTDWSGGRLDLWETGLEADWTGGRLVWRHRRLLSPQRLAGGSW